LSGQALSYDANGNLLADGQRYYTGDAESRLIGITYPGQSGKQTAFTYDGLGRRTAIASTPAGGSTITTAYVWCGARLCQARNPGNSPRGILRRRRIRSRFAGAALLLRR
jgi:YD repeat-containing protein